MQDHCRKFADPVAGLALGAGVPAVDGSKVDLREEQVSLLTKLNDLATMREICTSILLPQF